MGNEVPDPTRTQFKMRFVVLSLEALRSPVPRKLLAVWNEKRGVRRFPAKEDITPRDLKDGLRFISLMRVFDGGKDFEYRLRGDGLIQLINRSYGDGLPGRAASEFTGLGELFDMGHRYVVESGDPRHVQICLEFGGRPVPCRECLYLPLGEDGRTVDHILAISVALPEFDALVLSRTSDAAQIHPIS